MIEYLLVKRGLYWRPNGQGYTALRSEAGRYSEEYAADAVIEGGTSAIPADEAPALSPGADAVALRRYIIELEAEIARLKAGPPVPHEGSPMREALVLAKDALRLMDEGKPVPTRFLARKIDEALAGPPDPQSVPPEPVAWMTTDTYRNHFTERKQTADAWAKDGWKVTPLYDGPPVPGSVEPSALDVLRRYAARGAGSTVIEYELAEASWQVIKRADKAGPPDPATADWVLVPREPTPAMTEHPTYLAGEWSRRSWEAALEAATAGTTDPAEGGPSQ